MKVFGKNVLKETKKENIKKVFTSRIEFLEYCEKNNIKCEHVTNDYLNKLVKGNHQGVVIEVNDYKYFGLNDIEGDFLVMLDHLEDPHNLEQ